MKVSILSMNRGSKRFEVMNNEVLRFVTFAYAAYSPTRIDDDALIIDGGLDVDVLLNGAAVQAVSMYDLLWLERKAFADGTSISYTKNRVVKHIPLIQFGIEESGLEELADSPSFRISLSARCALWPDLDVHCISGNYFMRIVGDYWSIVGEQTAWV